MFSVIKKSEFAQMSCLYCNINSFYTGGAAGGGLSEIIPRQEVMFICFIETPPPHCILCV